MFVGSGICDSLIALEEQLTLQANERWICVQSRPHKELAAAENLRDQDYRSFVPTVWRQIRHARKTKTVRRPFFPRYFFVILNASLQPWRPIWSTSGVSSVIMENERPKAVPEGIVEALVSATDKGGSLDFKDSLSVGQSVRLLNGPFADLIGTLEQLNANGRVTVLLDILGGERRMTTDTAALQAVNS